MIKIKKIISAGIVFALAFFTFFLNAEMHIHLRALDDNGKELGQAEIGKPFLLEISIEGVDSDVADPDIEKTENVSMQRTGYQMHMINGRSSMKYSYIVHIDTIGTHSLGPAIVYDGNKEVRSGVLLINVGEKEVLVDATSSPKQTDKKMFLELSADKTSVIVGQKLNGFITFYTLLPDVSLHMLTEPTIDGFIRNQEEQPEQGVQIIDGKKYSFARWHWSFFTKQAGQLVIPASSVVISSHADGDPFSRFSSFFHFSPKRQKIYSNTLTIEVEPLPQHTGPVDAVGKFKNFTAHVNQKVAHEGDGIVLTLSIDGDADMENLSIDVRELPHIFKSYSSNQHLESVKQHDPFVRKSFEFIIQGMEAGKWQIPQQMFTYYDIDEHIYKVLKTEPLDIAILSQPKAKKYLPPSEEESSLATEINVFEGATNALALDIDGQWHEVTERKMPWWLFMVLFLAPVSIWFSRVLRKLFGRYSRLKAPKKQWRNAFKNAQKHIAQAKAKNDFAALYKIFIELFSIRCSVAQVQVSDDMIRRVLRLGGLPAPKVHEWTIFFTTISSFMFYSAKGLAADKELFNQANKWIDVLEDII